MQQLTMQDLFGQSREAWLESARNQARKLLAEKPYITIEDVLENCPRPTYVHRNVTGNVFNEEFKPVGFAKSRRTVSKGRWIRQWSSNNKGGQL